MIAGVARVAILCAELLGLAGCATVAGNRESAIATARNEFQALFPQEYTIADWDIIALEAPGGWDIMFAHPIADDVRAAIGEVARSGRLFVVSTDGHHVVQTLSMQ